MRIAFIGGTAFVGRGMVEAALGRGHDVTVFHRGTTGPDLFPDATHVVGDRANDLGRLTAEDRFDALVDVCAYRPVEVHAAADALADHTDRYLYVSSVSAYRPQGADGGLDEDAPLYDETDLDDPATSVVDATTYGPLEALCERVAHERFPGRTLVLRPCYVIGPHDYTDRMTWWVRRCAVDDPILALAPSNGPIQVIDVRDLGAFAIHLLETGATGAYHGVGPEQPMTWAELLGVCAATVGSHDREVTWVDPHTVESVGHVPGRAFPMWAPPEVASIERCSVDKSIGAGLVLRPIAETLADLDAWDAERGRPALQAGLDDDALATLRAALD